jgi:hypothetical protein
MVKIIFAYIILLSYTFASNDLFTNKIVNILDQETYNKHKNFINILFKNKSKFLLKDDDQNIQSSRINTIKIIKVLQKNGLLQNELSKATDITLTFQSKTSDNILLTVKLIQDTLNAIGYNFFVPTEISYKNTLRFTITLNTTTPIDPIFLQKELYKRGIIILDITKKQNTKWIYLINTTNAKLSDVVTIKKREKKKIRKSSKYIMIKLQEDPNEDNDSSMRYIIIHSDHRNTWYPYITFYDVELNILNIKKINILRKYLKLRIPPGSFYIKISDIYRNRNFKHGLTIEIN